MIPPARTAVTGEVCATGHYSEAGPSALSESAGNGDPSGQSNRQPKNGKILYAEIANYGKYSSENCSTGNNFLGTVGVIRDISDRRKLEKKQLELEQQILHSEKNGGNRGLGRRHCSRFQQPPPRGVRIHLAGKAEPWRIWGR